MIIEIKMVRFQYFSDVHTEWYKCNPPKIRRLKIDAVAPYLVLAGDIGDPFSPVYKDFIDMLAPKFKHTFVVSGNHEYYKSRMAHKLHKSNEDWMDAVDAQIDTVCKSLPNVTYLQNDVYHLPDEDVSVFGATFWTDINPYERYKIEQTMNDYVKIPSFTPSVALSKHYESCDKLTQCLDENPDRQFVVVSHHLPSYTLIHDKFAGSDVNSAYASNIEVASHPRVRAWVAGHTHYPMQKGKFYVNPIGYPGEMKFVCFDKYFDA